MIARIVLVALLVASTVVHAGPRKVLVLPLEGNANPALRAKLSASIGRLARVVDGEVTAGKTTLADTAAAAGCDPSTPACIESVRKMLGVDELVYGSANVERGQVTIVVHRTGHKQGPKHLSTTIAATDPADRADPALLPLFTGAAAVDPPADPPVEDPVEPKEPDQPEENPLDPAQPVEPPPVEDKPLPDVPSQPSSRDRNIGIATAVGGGAMLLIGFALWSSASSLQDEIDGHPTVTRADFAELEDIEGRASTRAWVGNLAVVGGLALGGYGGYLLWRDRKARRSAVVTPRPTENAPGVLLLLRGRW